MLRPGGRLAFYTIYIAPGLAEPDYRRVVASGEPPEVVSRATQPELVRAAGFVEIEEVDVTEEFARTARGWYEARERHAADMRELEGEAEFAQGQAGRKERLEFIEAGWLRRSLFTAARRA